MHEVAALCSKVVARTHDLVRKLFGSFQASLLPLTCNDNMSEKIKSKDLNYDKSLPPFLQRLHAQKAGRGDTDRHEQPIARAKRAKNPDDDDDDGPTVIDESGDTVSKEEYERLTKPGAAASGDTANVTGDFDPTAEPKASGALPVDDAAESKRAEAKVTDGTAQKKRKVAKVVGDDEHGPEPTNDEPAVKKLTKKVKGKKSKPVKLAFDDGDDE